MYVLRLTYTDEKSRHGYDESSLNTRDAHIVEIGAEGLEAEEELLLQKAGEYSPNTIFV